jgi:hypothetical protein
MQRAMRAWLTALLGIAAALAATPAAAADACAGFTWDVSREQALFAGHATTLTAGADSATAPALATGTLFRLQLKPIHDVTFVAAPGKKNAAEGGYAGLAVLNIGTPGTYRIALDGPFWIDVVADGGLVNSTGHQGAAGCNGPHKIVEFEFPVARQLLLQFSGTGDPNVRVTVTAAHH